MAITLRKGRVRGQNPEEDGGKDGKRRRFHEIERGVMTKEAGVGRRVSVEVDGRECFKETGSTMLNAGERSLREAPGKRRGW